ncbi:MAG: glutamate--tRNA ligase [Patescibacteria group bacterium]|jgi:glutamyl-tRNA synthetase
MKNVRTRIAPSPTGYVHIGTLHTALFNYFYARQHGGTFLIRIEDTDRERFVEGATEHLLSIFDRLGIEHDEGPFLENGSMIEKGELGPYIQSKRLNIYKPYIEQLIHDGHAYRCFCSKERLEQMRAEQTTTKQTPKYDRHCLHLTPEEVEQKMTAGEPSVVRMKIPEGETIIEDEIRGKIVFANKEIDDQVILKSDGFPTYHLAVVVDDHLMGITHVIRGEEWLPSAPKHALLYGMLGFEAPVFAHLPLLLNPDRSKLSKRQGDVSVEEYLRHGYLREALLNFVATLGYNPKSDQEIYELDELIKLFDLKRVNKAGAILNREKLDWMNNQYLLKLSLEDFRIVAKDFLVGNEMQWRAGFIEKNRVNRLEEIQAKVDVYLEKLAYESSLIVWKKSNAEDAKKQLGDLQQKIEILDFSSVATIEDAIRGYLTENHLEAGNVLWPLRVTLSGKEKSASPFELLWILEKEESMRRIQQGIEKLI